MLAMIGLFSLYLKLQVKFKCGNSNKLTIKTSATVYSYKDFNPLTLGILVTFNLELLVCTLIMD